MNVVRREAATLVAFTTLIFFTMFGDQLPPEQIGLVSSAFLLVFLFLVMLWAVFGVARHAECLARLWVEPYGTLILTVPVICIEVALIASIMITGAAKPALARDTMFSIIMIILNGLVGLSLVTGGLKHRLQEYNLQGSGVYLSILMLFALLGLVLPRFTNSAPEGELSDPMAAFLIAMSVVLYSIFLAAQTLTHSNIFQQNPSPRGGSSSTEEQVGNYNFATKTAIVHAAGLIAALLPTVWLSKRLALYVDFGIGTLGAPLAFGGFLIAALILAPKVLSAIRTARSKPLHRPINIYLSSALSTIGLTIPTVLIVGWVIGVPVELGLEPTEIAVLAMTLIVSLVTFIGRRTYMLQGAVHLALFVAYVILVFD